MTHTSRPTGSTTTSTVTSAATPGTVVVDCNRTDTCEPAVGYAVTAAARRHARLRIVIAFERPVDPDIGGFDTDKADLEEQARHAAERCLAPSDGTRGRR